MKGGTLPGVSSAYPAKPTINSFKSQVPAVFGKGHLVVGGTVSRSACGVPPSELVLNNTRASFLGRVMVVFSVSFFTQGPTCGAFNPDAFQ